MLGKRFLRHSLLGVFVLGAFLWIHSLKVFVFGQGFLRDSLLSVLVQKVPAGFTP